MKNNIIRHQDYVEILITSKVFGNFSTLIDYEDLNLISPFTWHINLQSKNFYVRGSNFTLLHRFITNVSGTNIVDHINRNTLDNRKQNLRICTRAENQYNSIKKSKYNKYKGVSVEKRWGIRFKANIQVNKTRINLGTFNTEVEAAIAYNKAAIKYFGDFARLNSSTEIDLDFKESPNLELL